MSISNIVRPLLLLLFAFAHYKRGCCCHVAQPRTPIFSDKINTIKSCHQGYKSSGYGGPKLIRSCGRHWPLCRRPYGPKSSCEAGRGRRTGPKGYLPVFRLVGGRNSRRCQSLMAPLAGIKRDASATLA